MRSRRAIDEAARSIAIGTAKKHLQQCLKSDRPDELVGLYFILGEVAEHWKVHDFIQEVTTKWDRLRAGMN